MKKSELRNKIKEIIKELMTRYDGSNLPSPREIFNQKPYLSDGTSLDTLVDDNSVKVSNDDDGSTLTFNVVFPMSTLIDTIKSYDKSLNNFLDEYTIEPGYDTDPGATFYRGSFKLPAVKTDNYNGEVIIQYRLRQSQNI